MADIEYNAYQRCMEQLRHLHQYQQERQNTTADNNDEDDDERWRELKFAYEYCVAKPLLTSDLKREMNRCIRQQRMDRNVLPVDPQVQMDQMKLEQQRKQQHLPTTRTLVQIPELRVDPRRFGSYCSFVWNDLVARRMRQMRLLQMADMAESSKLERAYSLYEALEYIDERRNDQNADSFMQRDQILSSLQRARELRCHEQPEGAQSPECLQLRERLFHPIASSCCREVLVEAQECSKELEDLSNKPMWYYAFRSWDAGTKDAKQRVCAEMTMNALQCFNKYFTFHMNHENLLDRNVDVLKKLHRFTTIKRQAEMDNKSGKIRKGDAEFHQLYEDELLPELEKGIDDQLMLVDLTEEEEAEARKEFEQMKAKRLEEEYKRQEGQ